MALKLVAILSVCAVATLLYFKFWSRPQVSPRKVKHLALKAKGANNLADDRHRGVVDRFLFEKSFGWEVGRILFVAAPMMIATIAIWWLIRNRS
jgi:hypothetical protein